MASSPRGPNASTFNAGYELLCATHAELSRVDLSAHAKLLRLGTRLWREGRRDRDVDEDDDANPGLRVWTPELVQRSLEWLSLRGAIERVFKPTLHHLADRIGARLRAKSLTGRTITVRVRFADLRSVTRSLTLAAPFTYHNGAESYYAARAFRGALKV